MTYENRAQSEPGRVFHLFVLLPGFFFHIAGECLLYMFLLAMLSFPKLIPNVETGSYNDVIK